MCNYQSLYGGRGTAGTRRGTLATPTAPHGQPKRTNGDKENEMGSALHSNLKESGGVQDEGNQLLY